jgi:RNA 2',3'-cyclic 3'-phosphodiesterase
MNPTLSESNSKSLAYRLFVALPMAASLLLPLERLRARLTELPGGQAVRWTRPQQLHLTLRFLGDVPPETVPEACRLLEQACDGAKAFALRLAGLGCFPDRGRARVVWVGISGALATLRTLQASVAEAMAGMGRHQEDRPFEPHLTIGRVRPGVSESHRVAGTVRSMPTIDVGEWLVDEVLLLRSELRPDGALYSRLKSVTLRGGMARPGSQKG